jgi:hypothetical protein
MRLKAIQIKQNSICSSHTQIKACLYLNNCFAYPLPRFCDSHLFGCIRPQLRRESPIPYTDEVNKPLYKEYNVL